MIPMTLAEVAAAVGGVVEPPAGEETTIDGSAADSRLARPGDLYVAIVGERVDGHDFAADAASKGAVAVLGQRPTELPTVVVGDPVVALGALASHLLTRLPHTDVVALTGSSGKTSTKDLLAQVLLGRGPVVAPTGSFNTEVGLPLTVLQADEATRTLVLEMGARGAGHIKTLCDIARPSVAAVLNVGSAHLGEFGSRDGIARAKSEIVAALPKDGTAVLYADDPIVAGMAAATAADVVTFGQAPGADMRLSDLTLDSEARPRFTLNWRGSSVELAMGLHGEHQAINAAAAAAVAASLGMELPVIAEALSGATSRSRWRMEVGRTDDGVTIVNDAYNANPESMRAALKALVAMSRPEGCRTWAVLGEMRELGEDSALEHDALGRLAVRLNVGVTVAVGEAARPLFLGASHEGSWSDEARWVPDVAAAVDLLRAEVRPGDIVLVKASRGAALEKVADALLGGAEPSP